MSQALVIVHAQNIWAESNPETTQRIAAAAEGARATMPVLWVYTDRDDLLTTDRPFKASYLDLLTNFNVKAKPAYALAIQPAPGDWIIPELFRNSGENAFEKAETVEFLRSLQLKNLLMGGFMACQCVEDRASAANRADFAATVLKDLTADSRDTKLSIFEEFMSNKNIALATAQTFGL